MRRSLLCYLLAISLSSSYCTEYYVDKDASGAGDGTSWADAWTSLSAITGVGPGDTVYVSGGTTSKLYLMGTWRPPSGNSSAQFTLQIGQEVGHNGTAIFRNNAGANDCFATCSYVTIDGRYNSQNRFRVEGYGLVAYMDSNGRAPATGVKLLGITTPDGSIRMYGSRKIEIGWIIFEPYKRRGGPGCIVGVGSGDTTGWGNNSIHDCEFTLFYLHGVDQNGDNGDDGIQNVGAIDIYNNKFISRLTTDFAGDNHQDAIQTDGTYIRIFSNYFENIANYAIFGEFWGNASDWRIYNNVINCTDPVLTSQPSGGIILGARNNGVVDNILIANNTVRGYKRNIALGGGSANDRFTNTNVVNNLCYGSGIHVVTRPGDSVMMANNLVTSSDHFVDKSTGDFRLIASSSAIDTGTSLPSSIFTADQSGVVRPQGSAWDIGAYEFRSGAPGPTPATHASGSSGRALPRTVIAARDMNVSIEHGLLGIKKGQDLRLITKQREDVYEAVLGAIPFTIKEGDFAEKTSP